MVEGMSPTITLISLIANGITIFFLVLQLAVCLIRSVLFAVMFEGMRPNFFVIGWIATSTELFSLCFLLLALTQLTFSLAATGMSTAILYICMIAIIITLPLLGIFLAFVHAEYDQRIRFWIEMLVMQRRLIRERRELTEERNQLQLLLLKLFPSVSYTSQGVGSKFRDCAICLNDFVEGEHCWVLPLCRHIFHSSCVHPRLRTNLSCPVCRKPVLPV